MTVHELYLQALALLGEREGHAREYPRLCVPLVNLLLAECMSTENSIRRAKGEALLTAPPVVNQFSDVVPCDASLESAVLPYGLASMLAIDDEPVKASALSALYEQNRRAASQAAFAQIHSVY